MEIETQFETWPNFLFQKQHQVDFCELYLTNLGTDSALDHKTKFVLHELNYNFYLGSTIMQAH